MNLDIHDLEYSGVYLNAAELRKLGLYADPAIATCPREVEKAEAGREEVRPLQKLPPSPTRSLGGYLDYDGWRDCERFIELDAALLRRARGVRSDAPAAPPSTRRCTARRADGSRCVNVVEPTADYAGARCSDHRNHFRGQPTSATQPTHSRAA